MTIPKLSTLILLKLSFVELNELFSDQDLSALMGWEFWSEKAREDFGIPTEFFFLVRQREASRLNLTTREISPYCRYLELASQFEVLPQMVKFDETLDGIFETYIGIENSLASNNLSCLQMCIDRLTPSLRNEIKETNFHKSIKHRDYSGCNGFNVEAHSLFRENFGREIWEFKLNPKMNRFEAYDEEGVMRTARISNSFDANLMISRFPNQIFEQPDSPTKFYAIMRKILMGDVELLEKILISSQDLNFPLRYGPYHLLYIDDLFYQCIKSGKIDMVNKFLKYYSPFPEIDLKGKKVEQIVPNFPFDLTRQNSDFGVYSQDGTFTPGRYYVPPYSGKFTEVEQIHQSFLFGAAISSGNPILFDFVCCIEGWNLAKMRRDEDIFERFLLIWTRAYSSYPEKFVGLFEIFQRFDLKDSGEIEQIDDGSIYRLQIDLSNLFCSRTKNDISFILDNLSNSMGKIYSVKYYLSLLRRIFERGHPISGNIHEEIFDLLESNSECPISQKLVLDFWLKICDEKE
nr:hypothetical protein pmam_374 [Pithovirus mammoth]